MTTELTRAESRAFHGGVFRVRDRKTGRRRIMGARPLRQRRDRKTYLITMGSLSRVRNSRDCFPNYEGSR